MNTKDTPSEEESQTIDGALKLSLKVTDQDGKLGFRTKFNGVSSTELIQAVMYLLDSAFKGNREHVEVLVGLLPDTIKSYYDMKEAMAKEEPVITQEIIDAIKGLSDKDISIEIVNLMAKEPSEFRTLYTKELVAEIYRRSDDGTGE